MPPLDLSSKRTQKAIAAASAAVLGSAGALYANNHYGFSYDIAQSLNNKAVGAALNRRIKELGDDVSLYHMLELADKDAEALWFEGRRWTYGEVLLEVDKLALVLAREGVTANDQVAVFMTNSPEMVFTAYAITKTGAVPAMINTALRKQTLIHCLNVATPKLIICTPDLASAITEITSDLPTPGLRTISLSLLSFPPLELSPEECLGNNITPLSYPDLFSLDPQTTILPHPRKQIKDIGVLIYTSGTSGKPKAVSCKNMLLLVVSTPSPLDTQNRRKYFPIRTFSCLPLFHGTCFFTGLCYSLGTSGTFCLARRFSARNFSKGLVESGATRMLYVGELCRYVIAAPPSPLDTQHKVIVATGNGLGRDVWLKFKARFKIPEFREVYRSTEGIAKFDNFTSGTEGAGMVGYQGPIRAWQENETYLVRYDEPTEGPWRDPKTGFCVTVPKGEPGEAIGRVRSWDTYNHYFNNEGANTAKIIRDVFEKGDTFQRSGDLLVRDQRGWVRFHDRSGDTFRWRGENVSAGEVQEHISKLPGVQDVSVFGVKLKAYDGQAGAAAITLSPTNSDPEAEFVDKLYKRLRAGGMTVYQIPRLVRFMKAIETTATFKHQKNALKERPWDPNDGKQQDGIWWLDGETYRKIDTTAWTDIEGGRAKL